MSTEQFETDDLDLEGKGKPKTKDDLEIGDDDKPVKYSTHRKLLNQLKNNKSELDELRLEKQKREEGESLKRGEYDKVISSKDQRIKELEQKINSTDKDLLDGAKLDAFIKLIPGKVKRQEYLSFVDLESIAVNPDTKEIDKISLERVAKQFVEGFPDLIVKGTNKNLPNVNSTERPNTAKNIKDLTNEELKKLWLSGKFKQ